MSGVNVLLWAVLAAFGALTVEVLWVFGYVGFVDWALHNLATTQMFVDLSIALAIVLVIMVRHATRTGRTAWPFVLLTLGFGSIGPLLYFALYLKRDTRAAPIASGTETVSAR